MVVLNIPYPNNCGECLIGRMTRPKGFDDGSLQCPVHQPMCKTLNPARRPIHCPILCEAGWGDVEIGEDGSYRLKRGLSMAEPVAEGDD